MAWIRTVNEELLNLDKISHVQVVSSMDQHRVVAYEPVGQGGMDAWAPHDITAATPDRAEAEAALAAVQKLVGAQTMAELRENSRVDQSTRPGFRRS